MSKTTFEPKTKTMTAGQTFEAEPKLKEQAGTPASAYESLGASQWKAINEGAPNMGLPASPLESGLNDFFQAFGETLKPAMENGLPVNLTAYVPVGQLDLRIGKMTGKEYLQKFDPVELPPRLIDAVSAFPSDKKELLDSITESRTFYDDYLNLYEGRKANIEKALKTGNLLADEVKVAKQLLAKLDEAIKFVNVQKAGLDEMENKNE